MSVNSVILDEQGRPLPLNSLEKFLLETDDIAEFSFICGNGYPGSTLGYACNSGKLIISELRLLFLADPELPCFKSFSCPFNKISKVSLQTNSLLSFSRTVLTSKITPQFEMEERIVKDSLSDLKIKFKTAFTAKSVEELIKSHLFTGEANVANSFDPLPLYSPPIPSYNEVTSRRSSEPTK